MFRKQLFFFFIAILVLLFSCSSPKYFHDQVSRERQIELKKNRTGNIFTDIGLSIASVFVLAAVNVDVGLYPEEQEFKYIKVINPTNDTIYINMLTDVYWDEDNYCDFMDIRIPPKQKCKVLVPLNANYNLYFSDTTESDDDELIEISTNDLKRISLYPGLTQLVDTLHLKQ